jgi:glycyl-tRNA synthetase beta chain
LTEVRGSKDFLAVSAAFKRMQNILTQAAEKGDLPLRVPHGGTLYQAEADLEEASTEIGKKLLAFALNRSYVAAFEAIATLRPLVDNYFDQVMILDPNPLVRQTRLWMLSVIVGDIRRIADLSEIVVSG